MMKCKFALVATMLNLLIAATSCSPVGNKEYLAPVIREKKVVDLNNEVFDPKADILFVVDNSASMDVHQSNLAANIGMFTSVFLKNSVLDYNIAVTSTDTVTTHNLCCGRFYGTPRVVNKFTPNADVVLSRNIMLGTTGDGYEKVFDPVVMALSEPNLSGWNSGFLRSDATLIVIFITDAEDQSVRYSDPRAFYDFLVKLKNGEKRKVLGFGAIVPSEVKDCKRDPSLDFGPAPLPLRIESFLGLTQANRTNILNLCAPDYGRRLAQFAADIVTEVGSVIQLSRAPVLSSIRVVYGSYELPRDPLKGWSFDVDSNTIRLGSQIDWTSQPVGSQVKVFYTAARFPEER